MKLILVQMYNTSYFYTKMQQQDDNEIQVKSRVNQNSLERNTQGVIMYIDMNSYFASCEQQHRPELRGKPIGVCTYDSPNACVIAPSIEAKKYGVKTGMRFSECRRLCPHIIPVTVRPVLYRKIHIEIINILRKYCDDVLPKSIDEAVMNFGSYKLVYNDFKEVARQIKADIFEKCGEFIKCSIGIAPNAFLAKLATELQKPDGLVEITPDNIDDCLGRMQLTDLPGIAGNNARRLQMIGLRTPLEMRHASVSLLRKAFGGIVGQYWHSRLNFQEVDMYKNDYRGMSATRTVSGKQRASEQAMQSLFISLCTKLEQRLVKQDVFCREVSFFIRYSDNTGWQTNIRLPQPEQDAIEMRRYIMQRVEAFQQERGLATIFNDRTRNIGVALQKFVPGSYVQYSLFDNRIKTDKLRKVMYNIKDQYGKNSVRKATETIQPNEMGDAIGFGSVKDLYEGGKFNKYMLEEG